MHTSVLNVMKTFSVIVFIISLHTAFVNTFFIFLRKSEKTFKKHLQLRKKRGKICIDNKDKLKEWVDKPTLSYVLGVAE